MQKDGKTEKGSLLIITAGNVCQTTSYGQYSWGVAVLTGLATGTQGQDIDKAWDLNNMPVDEGVITPEALSPKTPEPGGTPFRKFPRKQATGKRRMQSTARR